MSSRPCPGDCPATDFEQRSGLDLVVVRANEEEIMAHEAMLEKLRAAGDCVWDRMETDSQAAK